MEGTRPLSELRSIDWAALRHAYGSAADVPGLIEQLVSSDIEVMKKAEDDLWAAILHQGLVCDATALALPFVLGVLHASEGARRRVLIGWLTDLKWVLDPKHGEAYIERVRVALYRALPVFLALLEDPDEETRSEVVGFLGHTVGEAERAAQGLLGHVRDESSVAVQADVRMSLANLHVRSAELDRLTEPWITAPDEFRQIVAWSARLRARPEPDGSAHLASKLPDGVDGPRSWWGVGQPFSIMELLTARRGWSAEPVLRRAVVQTLLGMRGYVAYRVLRWVLAEFFDEGKASIPEHASDLKPAQFELLSSLSQLPDFFERPLNPGLLIENTQSEMRDFGLPCDHRRLTRWIAGETRTACLR